MPIVTTNLRSNLQRLKVLLLAATEQVCSVLPSVVTLVALAHLSLDTSDIASDRPMEFIDHDEIVDGVALLLCLQEIKEVQNAIETIVERETAEFLEEKREMAWRKRDFYEVCLGARPPPTSLCYLCYHRDGKICHRSDIVVRRPWNSCMRFSTRLKRTDPTTFRHY